jgi:MoxR-like ATPase
MSGAINAAIAANRPLLVRGEPGLGKTQLAEAAAQELERALCTFVVNSRTEHRDLLWRFDAVKRLAVAQMAPYRSKYRDDDDALDEALAEKHFVQPGPLWWALNWRSALSAATGSSNKLGSDGKEKNALKAFDNPLLGANDKLKDNGWVLLIDEIDKAESDVPNGLLEALGSQQFTPIGTSEPVKLAGEPPLVLITTNEERTLPAAFLRRCLVLHLRFPTREKAIPELVRRGKGHFEGETDEATLTQAATLLLDERKRAKRLGHTPLPGQAEFIDLVRAVVNQHPGDPDAQRRLLERASQYVLKKHPRS